MGIKSFRVLVILIALWLPALAKAQEVEIDALISFGDWSVFIDPETCWISSKTGLVKTSNPELSKTQSLAFVSFHYGKMDPLISFDLGALVQSGMTLRVSEYEFELWAEDSFLFVIENNSAALKFMLNDYKAAVGTIDQYVIFSLDGLQEAYNQLVRICKFNPVKIERQENGLSSG